MSRGEPVVTAPGRVVIQTPPPARLLERLEQTFPVPAELGVAVSLCRPSGFYIAAVTSGLDLAWLRWGHGAVLAEVAGDVAREYAAQNLARGMTREQVQRLRQPRSPARCDTCHRRLTTTHEEAA